MPCYVTHWRRTNTSTITWRFSPTMMSELCSTISDQNSIMPKRLTERERMTIISMRGHGNPVRTLAEVTELFNITFPQRAPIRASRHWSASKKLLNWKIVHDLLLSRGPRQAIRAFVQIKLWDKIFLHFLIITRSPMSSYCRCVRSSSMCDITWHDIRWNNLFVLSMPTSFYLRVSGKKSS